MAERNSQMLELGTVAPEFSLPDPDGQKHGLGSGADATHVDSQHKGALHRINVDGDAGIELAQLLIDNGADPRATSDDGVDPVECARGKKLTELPSWLERQAERGRKDP